MNGQGRDLSLARARYLLRPEKPLDVTGGIRIRVGREFIKITGRAVVRATGEKTMHYTLKRPTADTIYTRDWTIIVDEALREAEKIEKNVPQGSSLVLREGDRFRYEEVLASLHHSIETGEVLKILHAVCNLIPQTVPALKKVIQAMVLLDDSTDLLVPTVKSGTEFEAFKGKRPYLEASEFLPAMEEILPAMDQLPSNLDIIKKFLFDHRRYYRMTTREQYQIKLNRFAEYLGNKSFLMVRSSDITGHLEKLTVKEGAEGDQVAASTALNISSQLHYFYKYLTDINYYSRKLPNPVSNPKVKKRCKGAKAEQIIHGEGMQTWLDGSRWEDITHVIGSAKLAIRTESLKLLQWEDLKWDQNEIHVYPDISKVGQAWPFLTPEVVRMLKPFRNCKGPFMPQRCTPGRSRFLAKELGVVEGSFRNHGRKSGISHRGGELEAEIGEANTVIKLEHEHGHSRQVSNTWYRYRPTLEQAQAFRKAERIFKETEVVLSVYEARLYLTTQITGLTCIKMELALRDLIWNPESDRNIIDKIMIREFEAATKFFADGPSLPTFVKIDDPSAPILPIRRDDLNGLRDECYPEILLKTMNKAAPAVQPSFFDSLE